MRLKPNEPTDSKLNKEMINSSSSTPQVKTTSIEKPKPEQMIPKKDPSKQGTDKKAICACCTIF
jgi:hypothetical protein